jgi:hypothetical protein
MDERRTEQVKKNRSSCSVHPFSVYSDLSVLTGFINAAFRV